MSKERWSKQEWARAQGLLGRSFDLKQTAQLLGRSVESLRDKIRWEKLTDADRQRRREQIKARRIANGEFQSARVHHEPPSATHRPKPEQIAERDFRLSLPARDLTAEFFGDPKPGYSALERRA